MRLDTLRPAALFDLLMQGLGFVSWNFNPNGGSGSTAPTAGIVYALAVPYRAGQVVTNTVWGAGTPGAGTAPTHIFTGIADSTGKMLAQSADDAANAAWKQNVTDIQSPLSAAFTIPKDGLYYHVFLQVGAWGTTQLALIKNVANQLPGGVGPVQFGAGGTTGQAALPANGSSIAGGIVTTNGVAYFTGAT